MCIVFNKQAKQTNLNLFFQTVAMSLMTFKAVDVLTLMSAEQLPLVVIVELRNLKLPTFCSLFPVSVSPSSILFLAICSDLRLHRVYTSLIIIIIIITGNHRRSGYVEQWYRPIINVDGNTAMIFHIWAHSMMRYGGIKTLAHLLCFPICAEYTCKIINYHAHFYAEHLTTGDRAPRSPSPKRESRK